MKYSLSALIFLWHAALLEQLSVCFYDPFCLFIYFNLFYVGSYMRKDEYKEN